MFTISSRQKRSSFLSAGSQAVPEVGAGGWGSKGKSAAAGGGGGVHDDDVTGAYGVFSSNTRQPTLVRDTPAAREKSSKQYVPPAKVPDIGIGFSEFLELVALLALVGMERAADKPAGAAVGAAVGAASEKKFRGTHAGEKYHELFPFLFRKVLALLTVWGLGSIKVLEEVHAIKQDGTKSLA